MIEQLLTDLTIFVLAIFVGYEISSKVPVIIHTPHMSGTNAIHGPVRLASTVPVHATQMYSKNITSFLLHLTKDGKLSPDWSDDITSATCVTRDGQIVHPATRARAEGMTPAAAGSPARSEG